MAYESLYTHGFARVAAAVPHVKPADPAFNVERTIALATEASEQRAALAVFPELGLSAYAIDDLLHQSALIDGVERALQQLLEVSRELLPVLIVGGPHSTQGGLFNCGFVIHRGTVLGVVPKSYLPEYREYYEERQFRAAREFLGLETTVLGETVPFGNDLIFEATDVRGLSIHAEVCEDLWVPLSPSTFGALAGATVLANLSASNITVGKSDFRHTLVGGQSARCIAAYIYTAAGRGESTTDLAWDGQAMIYENGDLVDEAERFADDEQLLFADLDLDRMLSDRSSTNSFGDSIADHRDRLNTFRRIPFTIEPGEAKTPLRRKLERLPYAPADPKTRNERCYEVYNIQVRGIETRMRATGIEKAVIGVSGGLDSTHALIVLARAMDRLGLPRENILAYTMPGFATSDHTKSNAWKLMEALGTTAREIDIRPSAEQMLKDLEHPYARGEKVYDITFENVQAGERTSHLFRLANYEGGLVIGTGDLSRARARVEHVRRRRPDVALRDQRVRAQDADQLHDPLGHRDRAARRGRQRGAAVGAGHGDLARADPGRGRQAHLGHREQGRPVRAAGLLPVLHPALRLPPEQGRVPGRARLGREVLARGDQALARRLPGPLLPHQPVQAHGHPELAQGRLRRLALPTR